MVRIRACYTRISVCTVLCTEPVPAAGELPDSLSLAAKIINTGTHLIRVYVNVLMVTPKQVALGTSLVFGYQLSIWIPA